jgi:uncharacterized protein (DUF305 family)
LLTALVGACSGAGTPPDADATSPTAPVIQPGSPGQPNASLTGAAALPGATGAPDADDVRFMHDMIVHHAQAIVMVTLVKDHLSDREVAALASRIEDEQRPEIGAMARWLKAKGQRVPAQADNPFFAAGLSHDHGGMPGMATQAELEALSRARGAEADRLWLRLMTAHHEGALQMVIEQHRRGVDETVTQVGDEIHVTQLAQINHMKRMLDRLA